LPFEIDRLRRLGGPSQANFDAAQKFAAVLGSKGDVLQFGGKTGEAAELFNRLVQSLAVLAFLPGGVTFLGDHWEVTTGKRDGDI